MRRFVGAVLCLLACSSYCRAQSETATLSGRVTDASGSVIVSADVEITNSDTNVSATTKSNEVGLFIFPSLQPGNYRLSIRAKGFREIVKTGIVLNVQDRVAENLSMQVGSVDERVIVTADQLNINTQDATVSTVVDRNFAENLPLNGRSFQALIQLTPGVVVVASNISDGGQFSVNGQRANANYWMVDGVGANIGIASYVSPGNGLAGSLGSFSALGGTNSLVSVDALQEFRVLTSTYAPEFGRTPGAQISIATRSGTNQFHGTAFDYLRNDLLDANNWFADSAGLAKPKERQNDFGGTFNGPIYKDRTFFFFSYEGLRLRLPQTSLTTVPDLTARQNATPAMQPFLNAFPLPNGADNVATGIAQFNASYSNPGTLDAYSIRIDHKLGDKITLFGRYNYSPSQLVQRGANFSALNGLFLSRITTQTATVGVTWAISSAIVNEARFNYSRTNGFSHSSLDNFGGATPLVFPPFPSPFTSQNAQFSLAINSLTTGSEYLEGKSSRNLQRQFNLVDNVAVQRGSHSLKFGVDYRRLSPVFSPFLYGQAAFFNTVSSVETGTADGGGFVESLAGATFLFRNLGAFAQDTWRIIPRLTMTYGLRWDVDFEPSSLSGPNLPAAVGFNLNNLSGLALGPAGAPPFKTTYGNVAPRLGLAYQLTQNQDWATVLRGGFGIFYDLADGEVGNLVGFVAYPFGGLDSFPPGATFPFTPAMAAPPPIQPPTAANQGSLTVFDPNLQLPYTFQWNVALEQEVGKQQTITTSYIGSAGRRLIQSAFISSPNPNIGSAYLITNAATSDYNALQMQYQRRLSRGLQALASYTWSHSIDTASAGSVFGNTANALVPSVNLNQNRGPSDFDIRNAFSAAATYEIPAPKMNAFTNAIVRGWSLQSIIVARSAPPVTVADGNFFAFQGASVTVRPDVVPGQPFYLYGTNCATVEQLLGNLGPGQECPGGKALNPAAFTNPPTDASGNPLRQGNLGRNALRGFGATQWDFAVHRDFVIHESLKLQFRAEMFNVLNHPNFGPPNFEFGFGGFGLSNQTLAQSLGGNVGNGGFDPLYQLGGPRSIQLALKMSF